MLRRWRAALNKRYKNTDEYRRIKKQIIDLRKQLRKEGHDLRLGAMDIVFKGFKSDNALKYGYRRAVIYLSAEGVMYLTGDENHSDLTRYFEKRALVKRLDFSKLHNVWFRWRHKMILEIAGSDSESKEQYESMVRFVEQNKMGVLKRVRNMH